MLAALPTPALSHRACSTRPQPLDGAGQAPVTGCCCLQLTVGMSSWLQQQGAAAASGRYAMRASQDLPLEAEEPSRTPPSVRRSSAALRASVLELPSDTSPGRSERAFRTGNERLYEAYNDLHALAQDFEKPFDAPAILVVGHQTDGKSGEAAGAGQGRGNAGDEACAGRSAQLACPSAAGIPASAGMARAAAAPAAANRRPLRASWLRARSLHPALFAPAAALVEALMGFQFNHVGGGTKTRRPITLHMKYNSACIQPHCFLITDEFGEQEASLEELQVRGSKGCACGMPGWQWAGRVCIHVCPIVSAFTRAPMYQHTSTLRYPRCLQDYIENENARLDREAQFWCARGRRQGVGAGNCGRGQPAAMQRQTARGVGTLCSGSAVQTCSATWRMFLPEPWIATPHGCAAAGPRRLWCGLSTSFAPTSPSSTHPVRLLLCSPCPAAVRFAKRARAHLHRALWTVLTPHVAALLLLQASSLPRPASATPRCRTALSRCGAARWRGRAQSAAR